MKQEKRSPKWHLSTDMHPETVHTIGLEEVTRIKSEMEGVSLKKGNII